MVMLSLHISELSTHLASASECADHVCSKRPFLLHMSHTIHCSICKYYRKGKVLTSCFR